MQSTSDCLRGDDTGKHRLKWVGEETCKVN